MLFHGQSGKTNPYGKRLMITDSRDIYVMFRLMRKIVDAPAYFAL